MRYTDRYKQSAHNSDMQQWEPDWRYFPEELKPVVSRRKLLKKSVAVLVKKNESVDVVKKLDELSAKESQEVEGEEEEVEEEFEEDNDYNFDYYDDGGDNYGDDDDGEEGPVY